VRILYLYSEIFELANWSRQHIFTKGDNNAVDDRYMYVPGRPYALREEVVGVVKGYVPRLGWASVALQGGLTKE